MTLERPNLSFRAAALGMAAAALSGVLAAAAAAQPPVSSEPSAEACRRLVLDTPSAPEQVAVNCAEAAKGSTLTGVTRGIALHHAAMAHERDGQPDKALALGLDSLRQVATSDEALVTQPNIGSRRAATRRAEVLDFRHGRLKTFALASMKAQARDAAACPPNCLTRAIDLLEGEKGFLVGAMRADDARRNEYPFLLGLLYASRGSAGDPDRAVEAFRMVRNSGLAAFRTEATAAMQDVALTAGREALQGDSREADERALRYFGLATEADARNGEAHFETGAAWHRLAARSATGIDGFQSAERSLKTAISLFADGSSEWGEAQLELGGTYDDWAESLRRSPQGSEADITRLRAQSLEAFAAAARAISNDPDLQMRIAQNHVSASPPRLAEAALAFADAGRLFAEQGRNSEAALAYLSQAHVMPEDTAAQLEAIGTVLDKAHRLDMRSAEVLLDQGWNFVRRARLAEARSAYAKVAYSGSAANGTSFPALADADRYRADAYYGLSRVAAAGLQAGSPSSGTGMANDEAVKLADEAVRRAANDDGTFRRHACLARILAGGEWVTEPETEGQCRSGGDPDANLVKAMFLMRRAAQRPGSSAYDAERNALRSEARGSLFTEPSDRETPFRGLGWPGEPAAGNMFVPRELVVDYLTQVSIACSASNLPLNRREHYSGAEWNEEWDWVRSYWKFYRMDQCRRA